MSIISDLMKDLPSDDSTAPTRPIKREPSTTPPAGTTPAPYSSPYSLPSSSSYAPTTTPDAASTTPRTPNKRTRTTTASSAGDDDNEPSPPYAALSPAAKRKYNSIARKRAPSTSETRLWYCRERCDLPFPNKAARNRHETQCRMARNAGEKRLNSKQKFEEMMLTRTSEDVMNEWETLLEESRTRISGTSLNSEGGTGAAEAEAEEEQEQGRAEDEAVGAGLEGGGGNETTALHEEERSERGAFSSEFVTKYGATQTEGKDAGGETFAEFMAKKSAAAVEQAEPEVQVKVEDDGGGGTIPLGENWWVPK